MFGSVYVTLQFMVHVRRVQIHLAQLQCKYMWVHLWSEVVYAKDYSICIYAAVYTNPMYLLVKCNVFIIFFCII